MRNSDGRTLLALILVLLTVTVLPGMAGGKQEPVELRVGVPFKEGHILVDAALKFQSIIEGETEGRVKTLIIAGAASEEDVNIQCSNGVVDIQLTGGRPVEVFAPQYFFYNAPYVIKDYEHLLRVWNGPLGKKLKDQVLANGNMINLGIVFRGLRQTTANKPIKAPADLAGLKLRLPVVPTWIAVWKSLGADPVPVPLPELYQSLKDKKAEASEGDLTQILSFKLYEVQTHLMITNHMVGVGVAMMNKGSYDRLSSSDKKLVTSAMATACEWATEKFKASEGDLLKKLQAAGMTVVTPDAAAIREKAKPAVNDLFKTAWPVTTWEEVLAQ
jgi:tripartite ATP-independent transporter DctP family solute receptor